MHSIPEWTQHLKQSMARGKACTTCKDPNYGDKHYIHVLLAFNEWLSKEHKERNGHKN